MKKYNTDGRVLNYAAPIYDFSLKYFGLNFDEKMNKKLISFIPEYKNSVILDVGCGTGTSLIYLSNFFKNSNSIYYGIDAAPNMIKVASKKSKKNSKLFFKTGVAEKLNFPDNNFDIIINSMFLHHLPYNSKLQALIEMNRVLKPNGTLFTVDMDIPKNFLSKFIGYCSYLILFQKEIKENIEIGLKKFLENSGFTKNKFLYSYKGFVSFYSSKKTEL